MQGSSTAKNLIDMHVHLPTPELFKGLGQAISFLNTYFKANVQEKSLQEIIADYDNFGIRQLVALPLDTTQLTGKNFFTNDFMAEVAQFAPERVVAFATVNPHDVSASIKELERAINKLNLKGLKLHPHLQRFYPNDRKLWPLYRRVEELEITTVIHSGTTGLGAGMPAGAGIKLDFARPIYVDDVASEFPGLKLVCAHFGWPWTEELIAMAQHKPNVYIDLSGWAPKYFPDSIIRYLKTSLAEKMLFGSDYPFVSPQRWIAEFNSLPLSDQTKMKVLGENALSLLS